MAKFKKKPFKLWLDAAIATAIKTRDDFTCQWLASRNCKGSMGPLNPFSDPHHVYSRTNTVIRWDPLNLITLCKPCHRLAERRQPTFVSWWEEKYPNRFYHCEKQLILPLHTWRQEDYEQEERDVIEYCYDMNVDWLNCKASHRLRLKRAIEDFMLQVHQ